MATSAVFGGATAAKFGYTLRWVSSAAAGGGDGTTSATSGGTGSWTWAEMLTNAAAGHQVMVQDDGTYSLTTTSALTNNGDTTAYIVIAGTGNQNGADSNGGRPIIDYQDNSMTSGLSMNNKIVFLENLEVIQVAGDGVLIGPKGLAYDVKSRDHSGEGFQLATGGRAIFCEAELNGGSGIETNTNNIYGCVSHNNTSHGFRLFGVNSEVMHCIAHDNTGNGFEIDNHYQVLGNCTSEDNADGVNAAATVAGCAAIGVITSNNSSKGLDVGTPKLFLDVFGHDDTNTTADPANILQVDRTSGAADYASTTGGSEDLLLGASSTADELEMGMPVASNPTLDKGALQNAEPAGGGTTVHTIGF